MKNLTRLLLVLFAAGLLFTACEGPMGPSGADGKNSNDVCLTCHNTANQDAKEAEYHMSKHYLGTTSARNGKYCARCHTNEGFKEITGDGKFVVANDIPMATRISCETCHKHRTFEFPEDTALAVLRTITPVSLNYYNNTKTQDFGNPMNNLCSTCHQIRGVTVPTVYKNKADSIARKADATWNQLPFFPLDNTKEATTVKFKIGTSFSVHDGNQSNLFAGINGYEYAGKTYTRTWKHSDNACIDCHMNEYDAATLTGGHTLIPNEEKCTECHVSDKLAIVRTAIDSKIKELGDLLVAKKLFKIGLSHGVLSYIPEETHDYYGVLFPTTQTTTKFGIALTTYNTVSPTAGTVVYASTVNLGVDPDWAIRLGREWKYGELGAAYNYGFINSELSRGVHNPTYAMQVLQNSIDWLKAN